jgi:hypothetical protein
MNTGTDGSDAEDRGPEAPLEFASLVGPSEHRWIWFIPLLAIVGASLWYWWPDRPADRSGGALPGARPALPVR